MNCYLSFPSPVPEPTLAYVIIVVIIIIVTTTTIIIIIIINPLIARVVGAPQMISQAWFYV